MVRASRPILFALLLLPLSDGALAAKLFVAVSGSDGAACGAKLAPCRSIGAALARAAAGDTIEVGPGRYGDLDGDGLVDPGDEAAEVDIGCDCLVHVAVPVRLLSRDGAGATLIDAGGKPIDGVRIDAEGASFGAPKHGFTLIGSGDGDGLVAEADSPRIEANLSIGNAATGFTVGGDFFRFSGNRAIGNGERGAEFEASDGVLRGNVAIGNHDEGFEIETRDRALDNLVVRSGVGFTVQGFDNLLRGNASLGGELGFDLGSGNRMEGNAANANGRGVLVDRADDLVLGNQIVGNRGTRGVRRPRGQRRDPRKQRLRQPHRGPTSTPETRSTAAWRSRTRCRRFSAGDFWGTASGPGADPGDELCALVVLFEPAVVEPFAAAEIRPVLKAAQLLAKLAKALAPPAPAAAPRLFVSNRGSDAPGCGGQASPCRTIAAALAQAAPGDTIEVGPGRYGDANGDGDFDDPGDEPAEIGSGCECAIRLDVPVTLRSRDGAGATLLTGGGAVTDVVLVSANGVSLGGAKHGFTVTGSAGLSADGVDVAADGVRIEGNLLVANASSGVRVFGAAPQVVGNQAIGNGTTGFDLEDATEAVVAANLSIANDTGFELGSGNRATGNLAARSELSGFSLDGTGNSLLASASLGNLAGAVLGGPDNRLEGNVLAGNGRGIEILNAGSVVRGNAILGNTGVGVFVDAGAAAILEGNSIAGNHAGVDATLSPSGNCGVASLAATAPELPGNFWGAPGGPGPDPADAFCPIVPTSPPLFDPVATREIRVKVKAARLQ